MSYTALYRKWRPDTFSDVKGQEHIVRTLKNQIESDRVGHAYLFCGTRGTGKTTIAKILAKAVNCEHPIDGSPCGECAVCKAIANGSSLNVIEIDAASNNGVDNIRQIRDLMLYRCLCRIQLAGMSWRILRLWIRKLYLIRMRVKCKNLTR